MNINIALNLTSKNKLNMNDDALCYMFSFLEFSEIYSLVSKSWNEIYIRATGLYKINIRFKPKITSEKFIEIIGLPRFRNIVSLNISECRNITFNIYTNKFISFINTIRELNIEGCNIETIPSFTKLEILKIRNYGGTLPISIKDTIMHLEICYSTARLINFTRLEVLKISYDDITEELPGTLTNTLKILEVYDCGKIKILPNFTNLEILELLFCENTIEIPKTTQNTLKKLHINESDTKNIPNFTKLEQLIILNCGNIKNIPENTQNTLQELYISAENIEYLPNFTCLKLLSMSGCKNIKNIPENTQNTLQELYISAENIEYLPNFTCLKLLSMLGYKNIELLPINLYFTIEILYVRGCNRLIIHRDKFVNIKIIEIT